MRKRNCAIPCGERKVILLRTNVVNGRSRAKIASLANCVGCAVKSGVGVGVTVTQPTIAGTEPGTLVTPGRSVGQATIVPSAATTVASPAADVGACTATVGSGLFTSVGVGPWNGVTTN